MPKVKTRGGKKVKVARKRQKPKSSPYNRYA